MKSVLNFLASAVLLLYLGQGRAVADMLLTTKDATPLFGLVLDSEHDVSSAIQFYEYDRRTDWFRKRVVQSGDVRIVVRTVDQTRLQSLSLADLASVRDYAEELSGHRNDPVAQKFARRLLLLCMYHGRQSAGASDAVIATSAARTLTKLASNELELQQFTKLAYVYGVERTSGVPLQTGGASNAQNSKSDKLLLSVAQALRQERFADAQRLLDSNEAKQAGESWRRQGFQPAIGNALRARKLDDGLKQKLLSEELRIRFDAELAGRESSFQVQSQSNDPAAVNVFDIADFDLAASSDERSWLQLNGVVFKSE